MKIIIYALMYFILHSCSAENKENRKLLIGKWKIYKTISGGRDISKSSDPGKNNGLEFMNDGSYRSFGNPGHQGEGVYSVQDKGKAIKMQSSDQNSSAIADLEVIKDSMSLSFEIDHKKKLKIFLYRMVEKDTQK